MFGDIRQTPATRISAPATYATLVAEDRHLAFECAQLSAVGATSDALHVVAEAADSILARYEGMLVITPTGQSESFVEALRNVEKVGHRSDESGEMKCRPRGAPCCIKGSSEKSGHLHSARLLAHSSSRAGSISDGDRLWWRCDHHGAGGDGSDAVDHDGAMGSEGNKPQKQKHRMKKVPKYESPIERKASPGGRSAARGMAPTETIRGSRDGPGPTSSSSSDSDRSARGSSCGLSSARSTTGVRPELNCALGGQTWYSP